ncbi:MAG: small-conductance mechanosensitive channel [Candidatus Peregrinibacteria bacterium Greene0416_19]|nr:MAG: small-conductance mechanosensitive channel [Candidatus Peregrinibacteria bacterium Greene0416_19]
MIRFGIRTGVLALLFLHLMPFAARAEQQRLFEHEDRLAKLYAIELAREKPDPFVERKIEAEKVRVRAAIDDELNDFINAVMSGGSGEILSLAGSYDRQRSLVTALETRRNEVEIDVELLEEEDKKYYLSPVTQTGAVDAYRITGSRAELLARRVILEERQKALHFFTGLQKDRLKKLGIEQQLQQFSLFISIGKYLAFVLVWILIERFLRMTLFLRIQNRNRRYRAMKMFTGGMYTIMTVWILAHLFSEYPRFITSFAILGAGIAIALQDIIKDVIGWVVIMQKRLFTLGNRVAIGEVTGDVLDVSLLRTTLLEVRMMTDHDVARSGQPIHIPNSHVLSKQVLNFSATSDFHEAEIQVTIPHAADWERTAKILKDILEEETREYAEKARRQSASRTVHFYLPLEAKGARVFMELHLSGIRFSLRFPVPIGERRFVISRLSGRILGAFAKAKIRLVADPAAA